MLAHSVFTHLVPEQIELCLSRVTPALAPEGVFYASYRESEDEAIDLGLPHSSRRAERSATRYPLSIFEEIAERVGVSVERVGLWGHPRDMPMLAFRSPR